MTAELTQRSQEILRQIVDAYVETGEPVGSRTIARRLGLSLSPATIRNAMSDLEHAGLLYAPHVSAGRLPTPAGLRLFVHGLLQVGALTEQERESIEGPLARGNRSVADALADATAALSGLSGCASLVVVPKLDRELKHVELVALGPGRALAVIVTEDGLVENRVLTVPEGLPSGGLAAASNYLNARLGGRTLEDAERLIQSEIDAQKTALDALTAKVVEAGLASWAGGDSGQLIVRGQANLLGDNIVGAGDLEQIRALFEALETRETMLRLIEATQAAQGVQIFIGADNALFGHAGCSVIVTPYMNRRERIVGAIGVIGPTRLNYARIIPMVDHTAKVIGRLLG